MFDYQVLGPGRLGEGRLVTDCGYATCTGISLSPSLPEQSTSCVLRLFCVSCFVFSRIFFLYLKHAHVPDVGLSWARKPWHSRATVVLVEGSTRGIRIPRFPIVPFCPFAFGFPHENLLIRRRRGSLIKGLLPREPNTH